MKFQRFAHDAFCYTSAGALIWRTASGERMDKRSRWTIRSLGLILTAVHVGCSHSAARLEQPKYRSDSGKAAVEQFDRNSDGAIAVSELEASPALKIALPRIDYDHDGSVKADEINRAVSAWVNTRVASMPVMATISLDGRPLSGADVTLEPERFLGEFVQLAYGKTDSEGFTTLSCSNSPVHGVQLGWYRVIVSKKNGERETISERFNSKTELGLEVTPENAMGLTRVVWNVRSQ